MSRDLNKHTVVGRKTIHPNRKGWEKLDALSEALRPLQAKYVKAALKKVIKIFGADFYSKPLVRMTVFHYLEGISFHAALEVVTYECRHRAAKSKKK